MSLEDMHRHLRERFEELKDALPNQPEECLKKINEKWRELDRLQISTYYKCMSIQKFSALNSLDAIGLELTKSTKYPAVGVYIDEKRDKLNEAIKNMRHIGEIT